MELRKLSWMRWYLYWFKAERNNYIGQFDLAFTEEMQAEKERLQQKETEKGTDSSKK